MKKRRISVLTVLLAVCAATFAQGLKDVYKQMAANGKFEICALNKSGSEWMRLSGTLVNDETLAVKEEFLNRNESLKSMYKADDENMAVLYITNATARFCSFSAPERKVGF